MHGGAEQHVKNVYSTPPPCLCIGCPFRPCLHSESASCIAIIALIHDAPLLLMANRVPYMALDHRWSLSIGLSPHHHPSHWLSGSFVSTTPSNQILLLAKPSDNISCAKSKARLKRAVCILSNGVVEPSHTSGQWAFGERGWVHRKSGWSGCTEIAGRMP